MIKRFRGFALFLPLSFLLYFTAAQTFQFDLGSVLTREAAKAGLEEAAWEEAVLEEVAEAPEPEEILPAPLVYGIPTDSLEIVEGVVERGESLSQILAAYNISPPTVHALAQKAKSVFNVRRISPKRAYTILHLRDSAQTARYFIYEPSELEYVVYDLRGELAVTKEKREVLVEEKVLRGEIRRSLFEDMVAAGGSPQLVNQFADIYAWRLNLNRLQPGDSFKLIYDEKSVNGNTIGFGKIKAAFFEQNGKPLYAISFDQGHGPGYYDQNGKSLKKAFLKEPLEYTRISSRFSNNRFHPVQKINKPHLGTDFAAPRGTPIRTVGDGTVLEAAYTRGNGYYVKIKHNKTYTTQYLHLSKFAKGIRAGAPVQQGQTIGYVGSTGLATGPHLCYRFWKNGRQVDALREKLPLANPVEKKYLAAFQALREEIESKMQGLPMEEDSRQEVVAKEETAAGNGV
ncbi:peptidoglycan DD-metalloendopeptidase family protein [soil metagenome]